MAVARMVASLALLLLLGSARAAPPPASKGDEATRLVVALRTAAAFQARAAAYSSRAGATANAEDARFLALIRRPRAHAAGTLR